LPRCQRLSHPGSDPNITMAINIYNKLRRITSNQLYFPEIDGIRFLAIILVIFFHAHGYFIAKSATIYADRNNYPLLDTLLANGDRGVELFFVLSGFILCLPFAKQYIGGEKKVQLKKYYLRRVTRLEPPYIIAMTGLLVLQLLMHVRPASELLPSWEASLVYAHGFIFHHTPLLTVVAWSLEIEIQFYILAPLLFRVLTLPVVARRLLIVLFTIFMVWLQQIWPAQEGLLTLYGFVQYFLMGILLADLYVSGSMAALFNKVWMIPVALASLIAILYLPIKEHGAPVRPDILFVSRVLFPFAIALFYYAVLKNNAIKKVFSVGAIPVIGGMCYSVYLVHYTIISIFGRYTIGLQIGDSYLTNMLFQLGLLLIPVLLLSAVFYYFIERPFMDGKWTDMLLKKKMDQ